MTITIYGIKSCDSMKKTVTKLEALGVTYHFHDYKKQGIDKTSIQRWVAALGIDKVLNKRGTTWRKLTEEQKQDAEANIDSAIELLLANNSMIKRPIVEGNYQEQAVLLCGFDNELFNSTFV